MRTGRIGLAVAVASAALGTAAATAGAAAAAAPAPFGHACVAQAGVRFCPTSSLAARVPTWDKVPLDVDVTLPPTGNGPWPTVIMLHGFGGNKGVWEAPTAAGTGPLNSRYNNVAFAQRGYAVITHSSRGFGNSCGLPPSRTLPGCARGWWHMADQRYEVRDDQFLLGSLVDQGIARPDALGATGDSWGGGQSMQLAFLRNRMRLTNGRLVPWRSPAGRRLAIAAAAPYWPWSNIAWSLVPTGYFLDTAASDTAEANAPVGVWLEAKTRGFVILGSSAGFIAPEGADPTADPLSWAKSLGAGEPYGPVITTPLKNLSRYSGVTSLSGTPAPLIITSGFTDDLFPPREALRVYNRLRARSTRAPVSLQVGDLGHARGSNKPNTYAVFNAQSARFFDFWLRGKGRAPAPGSVAAMTQTCPTPNAVPPAPSVPPAGGPYRAASWWDLHPGAVRFGGLAARSISSADSDALLGAEFTADFGTDDACRTVPQQESPGTAVYRQAITTPFTMIGFPTVRATIATTGPFGQIASRLWDVGPDGRQMLISRGVRRLTPNQRGTITFQLNGNAYRFAAGHTVKLELMGSDYRAANAADSFPTYRPSNGSFTVAVTRLTVELPTREAPRRGTQIVAPTIGAEPADTP